MAKSIKLKNNTYWDSLSIVKTQKPLNNFLVDEVKEFVKPINISEANKWFNTGIDGSYLTDGTYIIEVFINSFDVNDQYRERVSGIVAWFSNVTNSSNADEISLSKSGHARNDHDIKLRILRQTGSKNYASLQITDNIPWKGSGNVIFRFRKII